MQTPAWICADGRAVPISAMSNLHIQSARTYLLTGDGAQGPMLRPGCSGFTNAEWVYCLKSSYSCAQEGRKVLRDNQRLRVSRPTHRVAPHGKAPPTNKSSRKSKTPVLWPESADV